MTVKLVISVNLVLVMRDQQMESPEMFVPRGLTAHGEVLPLKDVPSELT